MRVRQTCEHIFARYVIMFLEHLLDAPAVRQQPYNEFDRQPRAFDNRLAGQDIRINCNSVKQGDQNLRSTPVNILARPR